MNVSESVTSPILINLGKSTDKTILKSTSGDKNPDLDFHKKISDLLKLIDDDKSGNKVSKPDILAALKSLKSSTDDEETLKLLDELSKKLSSLFATIPVINSNMDSNMNASLNTSLNANLNANQLVSDIGAGKEQSSSIVNLNQKLKDLISILDTITADSNKNTASASNVPALSIEGFTSKLTKLLSDLANESNKVSGDTLKNKNSIADSSKLLIKSAQKTDITLNINAGNSKSISKEDKILKSAMGKETDTKLNKIDTLISQLNNVKQDIGSVKVSGTPVISKDTMVNDIIESVKFMDKNQLKELTVKLNPKDLGEVVIKLTMEAGNMKANISANNKDTFNLLNLNLKDIEAALNKTEVKIQNLNISLYQENTSFSEKNFNQGGENREKNKNSKNDSILGISEVRPENIAEEIENNLSILA